MYLELWLTCGLVGGQATAEAPAGDTYQLWTGCWDGHDANRFCTAGGGGIQVSI